MPTASIPAGGVGTPIDCGPFGATIANVGPSTVSYRDEYPVDAGNNRDGTIASGSSVFLYGTQWAFVSSGSATLNITPAPSQTLGVLDSSVARDGYLAAWDGTLHKFVGKAPGGTFRVDDEGALGTGLGDDGNAFRNAIAKAMAVQAAGGVGIVEANPTKTYRISSGQTVTSPGTAFQVGVGLPSTAGVLIVRGHGATMKLNNTVKGLFGVVEGLAQGSTIRNIILDDWVIDLNSQALLAASGNIANFFAQHLNTDRLVFRKLRTINGGTVAKASRAINVGCTRTDTYGVAGSPNTITRILFDELDLGAYGGVGGGGANVVSYCNQTAQRAQDLDQALPRAAVFADDITFRKVKYQTGELGVIAQVTGIFAGGDGYGGKVVVQDCWAEGSGDDNYEFPGIGQLTIKDSVGKNGYWENFMFSNNYGGHPFSESQVHILDNVKSIVTSTVCSGGAIQADFMNGTPGGRVVYKDVTVDMAIDDYSGYLAGNPVALLHIQGAPRHIELQNVKLIHRSNVASAAALQTIGLHVKPRGQPCTIRGNVETEIAGSWNAAGGITWTHFGARFDDAALLHLDDLHITHRHNVDQQAAGKVIVHLAVANTRPQNKEPFTSSGQLAGVFQAVNGTVFTDLDDTGANVSCVANPTAQKQMRLVEFSGAGDNVVGRWLDGSVFMGGSYQRQSGYRLGWRVRSSDDALTGIDCYITDDGANSILNIDEVVAGVSVNKATSTLGARVADAAYIGIRATIQGDNITLDYFLNPTTPSPAFTVAGTNTVTYTTTTTRLGKDGTLGYADLIWKPGVTGATIDNIAYDALSVLTGSLKTTLVGMRKIAGQVDALQFLGTDTRIRIEGRLRLRGNMRHGKSATTPGDVLVTGAAANSVALMRGMLIENYDPMVPPTSKTGTTWTAGTFGGSGAGYYQCPGPWPEDARGALAAGATTPFTELSRDGGTTFTQVAFAASALVSERLLPGDVLRFTGAVPASLNLVPVR